MLNRLIIRKINTGVRIIIEKYRRCKYYFFFKKWDINIGKNVIIRGLDRGNIHIGNKFTLYDNVIFEMGRMEAEIYIGDYCVLSYGVILSVSEKIKIGNNVWVGEYSSLRDTTHQFSVVESLGTKADITKEISIGNNVWIGRGSIILPGSVIGNNVIIGANSVVKGEIQDNTLYAGAPAKLIKELLD
jgi:acetyltransferase-like isoleucine patch superfamily enzyme